MSVVETASATVPAIVTAIAIVATAANVATATAIEIVATETGRRSAVSAATGTVIAVTVIAHMAREATQSCILVLCLIWNEMTVACRRRRSTGSHQGSCYVLLESS